MRKLTKFTLTSVLFCIFCITSAFAGPFGIEMGMSLAEVKAVCKTSPVNIQDDVYEITPPKTNDLFATYVVRIDPEYGVYWLKAIGKDIYTTGYGDRLISTFQQLVSSIRTSYGNESSLEDSLDEKSVFTDPDYFMYTLEQGARKLSALWSKQIDLTKAIFSDSVFLAKAASSEEEFQKFINDTTQYQKFIRDKAANIQSKLPDEIAAICVYAKASTTTMGYVALEYSFANEVVVQAKANDVF